MRLKQTFSYKPESYSVADALSAAMTPIYDGDVAEAAQEEASLAAAMLAALIGILHEKGILLDSEVLKLLGRGWVEETE